MNKITANWEKPNIDIKKVKITFEMEMKELSLIESQMRLAYPWKEKYPELDDFRKLLLEVWESVYEIANGVTEITITKNDVQS